ncbi:MAG: DUF6941 family protein [Hyphomicrobiales bacterium]
MDIDYALLADHAEVVSGKLYLMGGGWDTWFAAEVPAQVRMAVAVGIRVGWDETNQPVPVVITLEDDDGQSLVKLEGSINIGRPAHLPAGSTQLAQMAANIGMQVQRHGGYRVRIEAGEGPHVVQRYIPFRLLPRR